MLTPQQLIDHYHLESHPEGGHYREVYKSEEIIPHYALPGRFPDSRAFSTAIYFLLESGTFSSFHRIQSDECWHFYTGQSLLIYVIDSNKKLQVIRLGDAILEGELFQYVIPAGSWFASEPAPGSSFSFVGCTVAPAFDFADFELAKGEELAGQFPQHKEMIRRLCRI